MLGVKKLKKGDLLWQTNCQNDGAEVNFQPAIFVRNVRGDNVLIDIVQRFVASTKDLTIYKGPKICLRCPATKNDVFFTVDS